MTNANDPIPQITRDDEAAGSGDLVARNLAQLKGLFPEIVTDGKVDYDTVRELLGDAVEEGEERYGLNWKGKRRARAFALTPSLGTLRPSQNESVDWDKTRNILVEGDNLEALKLLRRSYSGQVKLIYIDPPYNTGSDFVYPDDYRNPIRNYLQEMGQISEAGDRLTSELETGGRLHTKWLNMMYPRLIAAREMLADDGFIFCSIDYRELKNLLHLFDEVFGEENRINVCSWVKTSTPAGLSKKTKNIVEYVVCYQKSTSAGGLLGVEKPAQSANTLLNKPNAAGTLRFPAGIPTGIEPGKVKKGIYGSKSYEVELLEDVEVADGIFQSPFRLRARFRWSQDYLDKQLESGTRIRIATRQLLPSYEKDSYGREAMPNLMDKQVGVGTNENASAELERLMGAIVFQYPKPVSLIKYLVDSVALPSDIIVDFFAGSGTTGEAVMQLNVRDDGDRRYILVQLPQTLKEHGEVDIEAISYLRKRRQPQTIAELTKERLRLAGKMLRKEHPDATIDTGFRVYKLDTSNLKPWQPDAEDMEASILDSVDNVLPGRTEDDLLVELLLKTGIDLTLPQETRSIAGRAVHALGGGTLMVCLGNIGADDAEALGQGMADWVVELDPVQTTIYFKDTGLGADGNRAATKANLAAILRQRLGDRIAKIASI